MRCLRFTLLPLLLVACNGDPLTLPTEGPLLSRAGGAGCQGVQFEAAEEAGPGGFVGTVSGDIVGTIETVFPQPGVWHGKAFLNDGIDFITVASSNVSGLQEGMVIEHRHSNMAVGAPGLGLSPRINGRGTIVSPDNVSGHLNFHGTFDISSFPPAVDLTYRGNICVP